MARFNPIETLWRRRNLILAVALMTVMAAYSLAGLQANQYGASALFHVRHNYPQFAEKFMANDLSAFLKKTDEEMSLEDDPNFNFQIPADSSVLEQIRPEALEFIENLSGETNRSVEDKVFAQLQSSVHIFEHPERQTIEIQVLSRSPSTAAEIANRLGEMYQSTFDKNYKFLSEDQAVSLEKQASQKCRDKFLSFSNTKKFDECLKKAHTNPSSGEDWVLTKKAEESWKAIRPPLSPVLVVGLLVGVVMGVFSAFLADYTYNRTQRR